jgi:hypothetical protein
MRDTFADTFTSRGESVTSASREKSSARQLNETDYSISSFFSVSGRELAKRRIWRDEAILDSKESRIRFLRSDLQMPSADCDTAPDRGDRYSA